MQRSCWRAPSRVLAPQLPQMTTGALCMPPIFFLPSSTTTATTTAHAGRRALSSSYPRHGFKYRSKSPASAKPKSSKPSKSLPPKATSPKTTPPSRANARSSKPVSSLPPSGPFYIRALSFLPPLPTGAHAIPTGDDATELAAAVAAVRVATTPTSADLDRATALFKHPDREFLYSAPRFLNLPVNTRMPEVCILGRSNVGKSSLLNALSGLEFNGAAGKSHSSSSTRRAGMAITSAKAGCTTMLNGYGFGPPLREDQQQVFARVVQNEKTAAKKDDASSRSNSSTSGVVSRSQKRARKPGEPCPAHNLVLLDMPGYAFASQSEWGVEIQKYLARRPTLRGAVLLVDAVAGLKDADRRALAMLRDADVRTVIVLTKADKVLPRSMTLMPAAVADAKREAASMQLGTVAAAAPEPAFPTGAPAGQEGEQALRASCLRIWKAVRRIERSALGREPWVEGHGWLPEILVTAAGDPRGGGFGVAGARLAICRMAGVIPKRDAAAQTAPDSKVAVLPSGNRADGDAVKAVDAGAVDAAPVVPFDQIRWTTATTDAAIDQSAELRYIEQQETARRARKARIQQKMASATEQMAGDAAFEEPCQPAPTGQTQAPTTRGRRRPWKQPQAV